MSASGVAHKLLDKCHYAVIFRIHSVFCDIKLGNQACKIKTGGILTSTV